MASTATIHIIGAGLAGSEAAWQLAQRQIPVILYEMRPAQSTPAHQTGYCAELVCSNSLRADDPQRNAVGVLHQEMRLLDSLILHTADRHRLPAGGALAVDREGFAAAVSEQLQQHPLITLVRQELPAPPAEGVTLIASGPLTSPALSRWLEELLGPQLSFYDALAPIVAYDSIDFSQCWKQSRYDKGGDDYINCPLDKEQYETFVAALLAAEQVPFKSFEKVNYFEGCLPIEVMAARGIQTLRFGPMKPVGLFNPHQGGKTPYAVVQLRQDNRLATLWNMVGFQTKLTWPAQKEIFRMIPGLQQAEFMRLGAIHRNLFIDSPRLLTPHLALRSHPNLFFAGQITGVEGYVESAACGLLAGLFLAEWVEHGSVSRFPPVTTAIGALLTHITSGAIGPSFQPMNINFGLFPELPQTTRKTDRKAALSQRALQDLQQWIGKNA
ncbi:MAG: methylenetetrahydrofolate--tRNA-(uracil(54)-C(5))-methyltransferase (FADH(2)-oxidizing) TrmFO [Magnetococcales bacterium]|nr:methylenetetrahydrofolate--tRNA-(uracil(54)-C(5))-methyltransferase (FADH(2)-oxidizing) TrmFO [Magnetococcales bacterium]